tara:strand:+ start:66 stop:470 length:405 start_codon:yes stop_codon:yes gene_type:complete
MGYIESTISGDEKVEYKFSYHWIKWVIPVILFISGFMLFFIPSILGLYLILKIIFTEQGVTTKKGLKKVGIISRNTEELLLSKVETVEIKQGVLGRILGYGDVPLTGTGSSSLVFNTISNPMNVKKNIESLLNK